MIEYLPFILRARVQGPVRIDWETMAPQRKEPLRVEAKEVGEGKEKAVFIFLHGFGDDAEGVVSEFHAFFLLILWLCCFVLVCVLLQS